MKVATDPITYTNYFIYKTIDPCPFATIEKSTPIDMTFNAGSTFTISQSLPNRPPKVSRAGGITDDRQCG